MTVRDLIQHLHRLPPDYEVFVISCTEDIESEEGDEYIEITPEQLHIAELVDEVGNPVNAVTIG